MDYFYKILQKVGNANIFVMSCYEMLVFLLFLILGIVTVGFCSIIIYAGSGLKKLDLWPILLAAVFLSLMLVILLIIGRQPSANVKLSFKVRHFTDYGISM
jgi:hypothetical protein